jgi:hypothetical protein
MQKLNDLSRSLTPLKPDGTLIAVIEISLSSFGARYVFDGRSHDRLAQRSSGLRMLLGPSPPGNITRSIAPSVVGAPAPHAAAPCRASGFVLWHGTDIRLQRPAFQIRGVVCPDHDDASNPKTLFIGANRPASLDQFVAPALSRVIRRLAPWE